MGSVSLTPLQDICLQRIIKSFHVLMTDCYSESGVIPRKHFEFLQRKYTQTLLKALSTEVISFFWSFLLNHHLCELDIYFIPSVPIAKIIERLRDVGHSIKSLNLRKTSSYPESALVELFPTIPNVEELYISGTKTTDKVLARIGKCCPSVRILDLTRCKVTTRGLKALCKRDNKGQLVPNSKIEKLYMNSSNSSDDAVMFALEHFPSLTIFEHEYIASVIYRTHKSQFLNIVQEEMPVYSLTNLEIAQFMDDSLLAGDVIKVCAATCPHVSSLTVENICTPADVLACCNFMHLQKVSLAPPTFEPVRDIEILLQSSAYNVRDVDYSDLLTLRGQTLTELELHTGIVSIEVLSKYCPNLKRCILEDMAFEGFSARLSAKNSVPFPKMRELVLKNLFLDPPTCGLIVYFIQSCPELERLGFPNSRFFDDSLVLSLQTCKTMEQIKNLDFTFCNMKVDLAKKFLTVAPNVEKMTLDGCNISKHQLVLFRNWIEAENRSVDLATNVNSDAESDSENSQEYDSDSSSTENMDD